MSWKKRVYLSPAGLAISFVQNMLSFFQQPFMVYGFKNHIRNKRMRQTRLSSSVKILSRKKLDIMDSVWIGHFCVLDASNGLHIGEGVQTGSHISIYSHSSHISIRLLGSEYLNTEDRVGYIKGAVSIGDYTFIGDSCVIFPGVSIGTGCLIKAGAVVTKSIPDYSIAAGVPATVVGTIKDIDQRFMSDPQIRKTYFDIGVFPEVFNKDRNNE